MLIIKVITESKYALIPHYIIGIVYSIGSTQWMPSCSPLWFLTCITVALFIFNLILHIKNRWLQCFIVALCCGVSYCLYLLNCVKLIWNLDIALMAVSFLGMGHLTAGYKQEVFENKQWRSIVVATFIFGMAAIHFNTDVDFDARKYGELLLMLVGSVTVSYSLSCLIYHFHPFTKFFKIFGKHTIFIMGFDYFSQMVANKLLSLIGFQNWSSVFCLKIIILTIGIYLWYWLLRFVPNEKIKEMLRY